MVSFSSAQRSGLRVKVKKNRRRRRRRRESEREREKMRREGVQKEEEEEKKVEKNYKKDVKKRERRRERVCKRRRRKRTERKTENRRGRRGGRCSKRCSDKSIPRAPHTEGPPSEGFTGDCMTHWRERPYTIDSDWRERDHGPGTHALVCRRAPQIHVEAYAWLSGVPACECRQGLGEQVQPHQASVLQWGLDRNTQL